MKTLKSIARTAGLGYLLIFICGFYANFYVLEGMWVAGDAAATTGNILNNLSQFRLGIVAFIGMIVVDVLMAFPLYMLLKPVNPNLALFAAWLRLVNGAIFTVAISKLLEISHLLSGTTYLQVIHQKMLEVQVLMQLESFNYIWLLGLLFFGLHLLVLGYLLFKAHYMPRLLGFLIALAAIGYLVDSFAQFLLPQYIEYQEVLEWIVVIPSVVGEFSLTLWLLIKGVRNQPSLK